MDAKLKNSKMTDTKFH